MAERRELSVVDDPLEARKPASLPQADASPTPARSYGQETAARRPGSTGSGGIRVVAARVPVSLADRLEGAALELRRRGLGKVAQQELLAALLWRYVDDRADDSLDGLEELIRAYRTGSSSSG